LSNNFLEVGYNFSRFGGYSPRLLPIILHYKPKNATNFQTDA